jgi:hypothetical protein
VAARNTYTKARTALKRALGQIPPNHQLSAGDADHVGVTGKGRTIEAGEALRKMLLVCEKGIKER